MDCIKCFKEIGVDRICKYCGEEQYNEPSKAAYRVAEAILSGQQVKNSFAFTRPKKERHYLTEEEILGAGFYPKDEKYKMSLISMILGKR